MPSYCYRLRFSGRPILNVSFCNSWSPKVGLDVTDRDISAGRPRCAKRATREFKLAPVTEVDTGEHYCGTREHYCGTRELYCGTEELLLGNQGAIADRASFRTRWPLSGHSRTMSGKGPKMSGKRLECPELRGCPALGTLWCGPGEGSGLGYRFVRDSVRCPPAQPSTPQIKISICNT